MWATPPATVRGFDGELPDPLTRRRGAALRPAPDAADRHGPARARRGDLRRDAPVRGRERPGLRQHRCRGRDGRRARRLVRRHGDLPTPARAADPPHRAGEEAQGRDRSEPRGVRRRQLPHRGDRTRPAGPRADRHAPWGLARRRRAPAGRAAGDGPRRAGGTAADRREGGADLPHRRRAAPPGRGAGEPHRRRLPCGDRRGQGAPRAHRHRGHGAARLARAEPRRVRRGPRGAGADVDPEMGRRPGHHVDLPAGPRVARGDPRRPGAPGEERDRRPPAHPGVRPPAGPDRHGTGGGAQGAGAHPSPGRGDGGIAVGLDPRVAAALDRRPEQPRVAARGRVAHGALREAAHGRGVPRWARVPAR